MIMCANSLALFPFVSFRINSILVLRSINVQISHKFLSLGFCIHSLYQSTLYSISNYTRGYG